MTSEQVHDYVLFLADTGLRPDEAKNLQHRDVKIALDNATKKRILEIEVRSSALVFRSGDLREVFDRMAAAEREAKGRKTEK